MPDRPLIEQLDLAIDGMLAGDKQTTSDDPTLFALMDIAGRLRDLPDDGFKTRLSRELQAEFQRRMPMSHSTPVEPIESGATGFAAIRSITPFICVPDGAG